MRKWTKELFWEVAKNYPSKEALRKGNKGAHRAGGKGGRLYRRNQVGYHQTRRHAQKAAGRIQVRKAWLEV